MPMQRIHLKLILSVFFISYAIFSFSQSKLLRNRSDSLINLINTSSGTEKVEHLIAMATFQLEYSYDRSQEYALKALNLAQELDLKNSVARAFRIKGTSHWASAEYDEAAADLGKAIKLYDEVDNKAGLAESLNTYGLLFYYQSSYELAIDKLRKSLDIFLTLNDSSSISRLSNNLGLVHQSKGDFERANQLLVQGFRYKLRYSSIRDQQNSLRKDRNLFQNSVLVDSLMSEKNHLLKSKEIYDLARWYSERGNLFQIGEQHDSAIWYFEKAEMTFDSLGERKKACLERADVAYSYLAKGETSIAETILEEVIACYKEERMIAPLGTVLTNLGKIAMQENNPRKAVERYKSGLVLSQRVHHNAQIALHLLSLSKAYILLDSAELAFSTAHRSYELADSLGSFVILKNAAKNLSELYEKTEDYANALKYEKVYYELDRKQENSRTEKTSLEFQAQLDLFQKAAEIERLNNESLESKELLEARTRLLLVAIPSVFLIAILSIVLYNRFRKTSRLMEEVSNQNSLLSQKNAEKEVLLKEIHHRVKNNLQMVSSLISMQKRRSFGNGNTDGALDLTQNRVKVIALIHEQLYKSEDVSRINLKTYVPQLVDLIKETGNIDNGPAIIIDIDQGMADLDTSVSVGMIIHELVTNSLKHAFNGNNGPEIHIRVYVSNGQMNIEIKDNGKGSDSFQAGFGFSLINSIISSHNGKMKIESENGFCVQITLADFHFNGNGNFT